MTIKWGDPIECNGVRPDWLRGRQPLSVDTDLPSGRWLYEDVGDVPAHRPVEDWAWSYSYGKPNIRRFKLPADHPAYVALARGFTPWSGGDSAPDDWDATQPVLLRNTIVMDAPVTSWRHPWNDQADCGDHDIIGYRKRVEYGAVHTDGSRDDLYVRIVPFTRAEWDAVPDYTAWAQSVGLIRPETTAERFKRETGHEVTPAVEAALNWKES